MLHAFYSQNRRCWNVKHLPEVVADFAGGDFAVGTFAVGGGSSRGAFASRLHWYRLPSAVRRWLRTRIQVWPLQRLRRIVPASCVSVLPAIMSKQAPLGASCAAALPASRPAPPTTI